jgi:hypothetical protein
VLPELHTGCVWCLKTRGREPLYKVMSDVVMPLAISASAAGFEEGDVLLTSYRAGYKEEYRRSRRDEVLQKVVSSPSLSYGWNRCELPMLLGALLNRSWYLKRHGGAEHSVALVFK